MMMNKRERRLVELKVRINLRESGVPEEAKLAEAQRFLEFLSTDVRLVNLLRKLMGNCIDFNFGFDVKDGAVLHECFRLGINVSSDIWSWWKLTMDNGFFKSEFNMRCFHNSKKNFRGAGISWNIQKELKEILGVRPACVDLLTGFENEDETRHDKLSV